MASPSDTGQDDRFVIRDEHQIRTLLKRMIDQRSLIDAPLPGAGPSLLTSVLEVDEGRDRLVLDASPDPAIERLALLQRELNFASRIDRVDIRFSTGPLGRITWERLPAYTAPIPEQVRYMQRREYFRLDIPVAQPVTCRVLVPADDDVTPHEIRTRVNDISMGGLSLVIPFGEETSMTPGARFGTCRLLLPDSQPVTISLRIRRLFRAGHRSGISKGCAGCEYIDLSPAAETAIQRYLMRLERERISRERGRV
jgi:flagellar brake protein